MYQKTIVDRAIYRIEPTKHVKTLDQRPSKTIKLPSKTNKRSSKTIKSMFVSYRKYGFDGGKWYLKIARLKIRWSNFGNRSYALLHDGRKRSFCGRKWLFCNSKWLFCGSKCLFCGSTLAANGCFARQQIVLLRHQMVLQWPQMDLLFPVRFRRSACMDSGDGCKS